MHNATGSFGTRRSPVGHVRGPNSGLGAGLSARWGRRAGRRATRTKGAGRRWPTLGTSIRVVFRVDGTIPKFGGLYGPLCKGHLGGCAICSEITILGFITSLATV